MQRAGLVLAALTAGLAPGSAGADPGRSQERAVVVQHRSAGATPVWGPRYAAVTADLYMNVRSIATMRHAYRALIKLQHDHPHRLRIVVRLVDLPASGAYVAEAALEAHRQGRFFEFLEALVDARQPPARNQLDELCTPARVDCDKVEDAIANRHHVDTLEANRRHMARMGVRHTSGTVLFNGVETPLSITNRTGASSETLEKRYDLAYRDALELMRRGATLATVYQRALRERHTAEPPAPVPWDSIDGVHRQPRGVSFRPSRLAGQRASSMARHTRPADDARVVINFFCSFQSMNCGSTWGAIRHVLQVYPDEVHLQFNHLYDEKDANQPDAERAHEAALCAEDQGAFWEFYDYQFGSVSGRPAKYLDNDTMTRTAQSLGLDAERFLGCWNKGEHNAEVRSLVARSRAAGVRRTPTVIVNGRLYEGRFQAKLLLRVVAEELRPGLLEHHFPSPEAVPGQVR